jgi:hypothetical protein
MTIPRLTRKTRDKSSDARSLSHRGGEEKGRRGWKRTPRDVKNEGTSGDVHENKGKVTVCPTQKTPFLNAGTPFYPETHVFCRNCQLLVAIRALVERISRVKMWKARCGDFTPPNGGVNPPLPSRIGALPICAGNVASPETHRLRPRDEISRKSLGEPGMLMKTQWVRG